MVERTEMKSEYTQTELESLRHRFDAFCKKVIEHSVSNQIRSYIRHCKNYTAVPIEMESFSTEDLYSSARHKMSAGDETVMIDNDDIAEVLLEMQEKKRQVLLLNAALDYSLAETARILGIAYTTARSYKTRGLQEMKGKIESNGKKKRWK